MALDHENNEAAEQISGQGSQRCFEIAKKLAQISLSLHMFYVSFCRQSLPEKSDSDAIHGIRSNLDEVRDQIVQMGIERLDTISAAAKPIEELNPSLRVRKLKARVGIVVAGQLQQYTADELLELKNFGVVSLAEVRAKLAGLGLKLKGD